MPSVTRKIAGEAKPVILKSSDAITFVQKTKLDPLVSVVTSSYRATNLTTPSFSATEIPADAYNCFGDGCTNTGTMSGTATATAPLTAYKILANATEFSAGVLTVMVKFAAAATYTASLHVGDYAASAGTAGQDYVTWTVSVTTAAAGTFPVTFDMSQAPTATVNAGWTPSTTGIDFAVALGGVTAGQVVGLSSVNIYGSIDELNNKNDIVVASLSSIEITDAIETTAAEDGTTDLLRHTVEGTITANKLSSNALMLSPGTVRTRSVSAPKLVIKQMTPVAETINGVAYATLTVSDIFSDRCYPLVPIVDICGLDGKGVQVVSLAGSDYGQTLANGSMVLLSSANATTRTGKIIMNASYVGTTVNVSYYKTVTGDKYAVGDDFGTNEWTVIIDEKMSNGKTRVTEIPNVLITSAPSVNLSATAATQSTISFVTNRDENNNYKYTYIVD